MSTSICKTCDKRTDYPHHGCSECGGDKDNFITIDRFNAMERVKIVKRIKQKTPLIIVMWIINLIIFTGVLWGGHYMQTVLNMKWVEIPMYTTLWSCGIAKVIFSSLLMYSLLNTDQIKENDHAK